MSQLIFKGTIANGTTRYFGIPTGAKGLLFLDVAWKDATSAATITVESTGWPAEDAPIETPGTARHWETEAGIVIAGPTGVGEGKTTVHVSNFIAPRARMRFQATAACDVEIYAEAR